MPNLRTSKYGRNEEGPWEGAPKWVRVQGREGVARVLRAETTITPGVNVMIVRFESGETCLFDPDSKILTRCDEDGNTEKP